MLKSSPRKGSAMSSSKKGSPGNKKDRDNKASPNEEKSSDQLYKDDQPVALKNVKRRLVWTGAGWPDYKFTEFRCPVCRLVLDAFPKFMAHSCWRKYYQARFHLGETQAFACRTCNQVFYSHADYASHECNDHKLRSTKKYREVEEVLPIDYPEHFDFYVALARRTEWESKPHEPNCQYSVRCSKCSGTFKSKIHYLLHSCFQFSLLPPAAIRRLKTCISCRYVFLNEQQYNLHLPYCLEDRAFCIDFAVSLTELACEQFVLGRHCYEYDYHIHHGAALKQRGPGEPPGEPARSPSPLPSGQSLSVICFDCGFVQPNLVEYFYHPCVAGKLITPLHLELMLFCTDCHCLFTCIEDCVEHSKSCSALIFTFIRLNTPELIRLALKRWTLEVLSNPYLPARQVKFMCRCCKEIFRWFDLFLSHACPRRERYERIFLQPSALMETYSCHACHLVLFSVSEAVSHSANCPIGKQSKMIQIHYTLDEVIIALSPWMRGPQLLQFDINIGLGEWNEEMAYRTEENRIAKGIYEIGCLSKYKGSQSASVTISKWLDERSKKPEKKVVDLKLEDKCRPIFAKPEATPNTLSWIQINPYAPSSGLKPITLPGVHWNQKVC
ncbi:Thymidylate kinase [Paragonimus westermani]|uniref:Thymidylate kinase n=1 Tax=Paragonimus westermani TaxID=34504 RepID=A0A8T0DGR4_9TREM|nr:Thymidylate kinase [Paragonimus westermani]